MNRIKAQVLEDAVNKSVEYVNSIMDNTKFKLIYLEFEGYSVLSYEFIMNSHPQYPIRVYQDRCDYNKQVDKRKAKEQLYMAFLAELTSTFSGATLAFKMRQINEAKEDKADS